MPEFEQKEKKQAMDQFPVENVEIGERKKFPMFEMHLLLRNVKPKINKEHRHYMVKRIV